MSSDSKEYFQPDGGSDRRLYVVLAVIAALVVTAVGAGLVLGMGETTENSATGSADYTELYDNSRNGVVGIIVVAENGTSGGTGFIYDEDGHIVTNAHVIANADRIEVQYSNGDWVKATVIGVDADSDLAVLRPEKAPESAEPLDMSEENPERGDRVMVLGSPLDLDETVSHGIVSGTGRELRRSNGFVIPDIVQTDAPVNPGNSGSPVVDTDGDVVGVVSARQGDNIGFAISAEMTNVIVPQLIEEGTVDHSYVGIRTIQNDPVVADANNYSRDSGMVVVDVVSGSPADGVLEGQPENASETTGEDVTVLNGGDLIVGIDGKEVRSGQDLSAYLMKHTKPGDTVTVTVIRDGEEMDVELTLGERP